MKEEKFTSKATLKEWLKERGVPEDEAASAAGKLFDCFKFPSALIGISTVALEGYGLDFPTANMVSNKVARQHVVADRNPMDDFIARVNFKTLWRSVLRVRHGVAESADDVADDESADDVVGSGTAVTALVYDIVDYDLYLIMPRGFAMLKSDAYIVEFCIGPNKFYKVGSFEKFELHFESRESDYVTLKVGLRPSLWEPGNGIAYQTEEGERRSEAVVVLEKATVTYVGPEIFSKVKALALHTGRWVGEASVTSWDRCRFSVEGLEDSSCSGGAVIANESGHVVGFLGNPNDSWVVSIDGLPLLEKRRKAGLKRPSKAN